MRIVVTGASGFLGTELLRQLIAFDEYEIHAATSRPEELQAKTSDPRVTIANSEALLEKGFFVDGDIVINCAFPRGSNGFDLARGLDYLSQLAANAASSRISGFINISSQSVYDQHRDMPATEDDPLCLQSSYAVAKRAIELLVETQLSDIPFSNIRLASLLGPGFNQRVPNRMSEKALETGRIEVFENGSQFGFMDVRDAAKALCTMIMQPMENLDGIYNLSSNHVWDLWQIAVDVKQTIEAMYGKEIIIEQHDAQGEPVNTMVDSGLFYSTFDWFPSYSRLDTVRAIVSAFGE